MKVAVRGAVERGAVGAALAALVLSGGAVACSKGGAEESPRMTPAAAVAEAAKNADQITSMHYRLTGTVPGEGRVSGEARMSMEPLAMAMKMTAEDQSTDGPVEVRLVDKAMYIGGAAAAKEMNGKSWIKFDLAALGADKELNADQLGAGQADRNPAQESTFLTGSKRVTKVGTETVGGVRTTHYKGDVTVDEMRASLKKQHLDKTTLERREKSLDQYEKMGAGTITMDMWIDGSDHTKQFRTRSDTDKGVLDMTITFLDFNKPVSVTAPPAKDTLSLADMMKSAQQG
ncbi:DUF1396 domain-containing protein [Streptomyces chiangmaiensis]|uniref:DUF1396 domain-containing protein n=1 Tax=Streptomyces chiangmaiensis TaxID=766497 RepID=A0ABU7FHA4_9ACTN|nr:DUF1396 domain-containing protein [Streptomyces chiangmaiensis]MED7823506.1 DUF1396 domain-containing protein [Streptomyces chiangmaiensis]